MAGCNHVVETNTVEKAANWLHSNKVGKSTLSEGESGTPTKAWPCWWPPSWRCPGGTRRGTAAIWGKLRQPSVETKTFLDTLVSPVLASSGCYLGAAGQSSVGLVAVAAMPGKPSAGESPLLSGCTTVLLLSSCCTAPLCRSVLLHSSYPPLPRHPYYVAANRKPSFIVFTGNVCRKTLLSNSRLPHCHFQKKLILGTDSTGSAVFQYYLSFMTNKQSPKKRNSFRLIKLRYRDRFISYCHIFC